VRKGQRVSWVYQGKRTFGTVTAMGGARAAIKGPKGGNIVRIGTADDPVIKVKSESTGNPVLKRRSQLKAAPKKK